LQAYAEVKQQVRLQEVDELSVFPYEIVELAFVRKAGLGQGTVRLHRAAVEELSVSSQ
jgi:hypothetical protein